MAYLFETIPKNELRRLYLEKHYSLARCAKHFKVSTVTIKRALRAQGIKIRSVSEALKGRARRNAPYRRLSRKKLHELYCQRGLPARMVADELGVTEAQVRKALTAAGITIRSRTESVKLNVENIRRLKAAAKRCPRCEIIFDDALFEETPQGICLQCAKELESERKWKTKS